MRRALAGRHPAGPDRLLRRRQDARRDDGRRSRPASSRSTSNPLAGAGAAEPSGLLDRPDAPPSRSGSTPMSMPRPTPRSPRARGEQVRHRSRPRARDLAPRRELPGIGPWPRRPYRLAAHRSGALPRRLRAGGRTGADAARGRPRHRAPGPRRRSRHPLPRRDRAGARRPTPPWSSITGNLGCQLVVGAGPRPCRQRRYPGVEGDLWQDRGAIASS